MQRKSSREQQLVEQFLSQHREQCASAARPGSRNIGFRGNAETDLRGRPAAALPNLAEGRAAKLSRWGSTTSRQNKGQVHTVSNLFNYGKLFRF